MSEDKIIFDLKGKIVKKESQTVYATKTSDRFLLPQQINHLAGMMINTVDDV